MRRVQAAVLLKCAGVGVFVYAYCLLMFLGGAKAMGLCVDSTCSFLENGILFGWFSPEGAVWFVTAGGLWSGWLVWCYWSVLLFIALGVLAWLVKVARRHGWSASGIDSARRGDAAVGQACVAPDDLPEGISPQEQGRDAAGENQGGRIL